MTTKIYKTLEFADMLGEDWFSQRKRDTGRETILYKCHRTDWVTSATLSDIFISLTNLAMKYKSKLQFYT